MNCNIFRVQFANNFHIFLHICHGLPGKAGDKVHVDDGKTQFPTVLIHGVNIFDPVAPAQGIEEMLLQRLGIDADAIDTGLSEHGQHVRRRRIGPSRFDGPFAGSGKFRASRVIIASRTGSGRHVGVPPPT